MIIISNTYCYESTSFLPDLNLRMAMFLICRKKAIHFQNQLKRYFSFLFQHPSTNNFCPRQFGSRCFQDGKMQNYVRYKDFILWLFEVLQNFQFGELSNLIHQHCGEEKDLGQQNACNVEKEKMGYFVDIWEERKTFSFEILYICLSLLWRRCNFCRRTLHKERDLIEVIREVLLRKQDHQRWYHRE